MTMAIPDLTDMPLAGLLSLSGRGAVVTGGANGIGYAIARRLSEAGAAVVLGDIVDAAPAARALAEEHGGRVVPASLDATDPASIAACADRALEELGSLDIWVNNAGIYPRGPTLEMTDADWDRVLDLNLRGTFIGSREAATRMVRAGRGGVIINLASTAGYRVASPDIAHYVASKHAVRGLTKALAVELGPHGIRVLALAPTLILTQGTAAALQAPDADDFREARADLLPLRRIGVPDDVGRVALFCASGLSAFMTGSTLPVDAGHLAV